MAKKCRICRSVEGPIVDEFSAGAGLNNSTCISLIKIVHSRFRHIYPF